MTKLPSLLMGSGYNALQSAASTTAGRAPHSDIFYAFLTLIYVFFMSHSHVTDTTDIVHYWNDSYVFSKQFKHSINSCKVYYRLLLSILTNVANRVTLRLRRVSLHHHLIVGDAVMVFISFSQ